jgi:hypothetical protein
VHKKNNRVWTKVVNRSSENMAKLKYLGMSLRDKNYIDMETKKLLHLGMGYNHLVQSLLLKNIVYTKL